jgi:23S rRNA (adenine2503-C2)-methyltransferase
VLPCGAVTEKHNLFGLGRRDLETLVLERRLPAYRARQIYRGMYARGVDAFEAMTELPKSLRRQLAESFVIARPVVSDMQASRDGTIKYAFSLGDGKLIESVYIPEPAGFTSVPARATLCLSTQVGCPLGCTFCYSGTIRFARNLTVGEILGQFVGVMAAVASAPPRINIVFMGMGEPLLNTDAVLGAIAVLTDPGALAVSPRRITVSTVGLTPEIERFVREAPKVGLAVSLHAASNELRGRIMPINRKHPVEEVVKALKDLPLPRRRRVTLEYVLLGGENDSEQDALALARLLKGVKSKLNLIAYNPWPGSPHRRSTGNAASRFMEILTAQGYTVSLRRSRGDDISAACGQLALKTS